MSCRRCLIVLMLLACAPASHALLPKNAEFRQTDVFNYRQRKQFEYEQAQQKHDADMISKDRKIRQAMAVSPWGNPAVKSSVAQTGAIRSDRHGAVSGQFFRKWTFSLITLLSISGLVWWVRKATEKELGR